MLQLSGPYGWYNFQFVSIKLVLVNDKKLTYENLENVLLKYSCHKPAIPKIFNSLVYSNQYECFVQLSWLKHDYSNCIHDLGESGIQLICKGVYSWSFENNIAVVDSDILCDRINNESKYLGAKDNHG